MVCFVANFPSQPWPLIRDLRLGPGHLMGISPLMLEEAAPHPHSREHSVLCQLLQGFTLSSPQNSKDFVKTVGPQDLSQVAVANRTISSPRLGRRGLLLRPPELQLAVSQLLQFCRKSPNLKAGG